jgi:uncharacterized RDD family membrane protein YckC
MYRDMYSDSSGLPDPDTDPQFYADVPVKRLVAWLIDTVLIAILSLLALASTLFLAIFIFPLIFAAVHLVYRSVFIARGSATPGMRVMGIELRNHLGHRFGPGEAVVHTLAYSVVSAFVLPQIVGIVMMLTTARGQGLHDLLLGSTAINRPATSW